MYKNYKSLTIAYNIYTIIPADIWHLGGEWTVSVMEDETNAYYMQDYTCYFK